MSATNLADAPLDPSERIAAARRHSRLVARLSSFLVSGAIAIGLTGIAVTVYGAWSVPTAPVVEGSTDDGRVVMDTPSLEGRDSADRPYLVQAERALQQPSDLNRLQLEGISGEVPMGADTRVAFSSAEGFFDAENQLLDVLAPLTLTTSDGSRALVQDGRIDLLAGSFVTDKPVEVETPNTTLTARSLRIDGGGRTATFVGDVRMVVVPDDVRPSE